VILLDQRGCGKSRPIAETRENTTWHLVDDIEKLRKHLEIDKWFMVFGGSWGSALAIAYAQTYPVSVGSLVLRGICMVTAFEEDWININGAPKLFPDAYEEFINFLPENERGDPKKAYNSRLVSDDPKVVVPAAKAWNKWGTTISRLLPSPDSANSSDDTTSLIARARIESHNSFNKAWLEEGQLLKSENIDKIGHIPGKANTCSASILSNVAD
jgi:proline iminopeptidase